MRAFIFDKPKRRYRPSKQEICFIAVFLSLFYYIIQMLFLGEMQNASVLVSSQVVEFKDYGDASRTLSNKVLISKLFNANSKTLIPFFFEKETEYDQNTEITLLTIITVDRFQIFIRTLQSYNGPVSVALHLKDDKTLNQNINHIKESIKLNIAIFNQKCDIHLIIDGYSRQFNYWRNVARLYSKTKWNFMVDVDFAVQTDLKSNFWINPLVKKNIANNVNVPALEFYDKDENKTVDQFPTTKSDVKELAELGVLGVFHGKKNKGHTITNFPKWFNTKQTFQINENWDVKFEPYAIFDTLITPWCDERFTGYGRNKAACWFEIYLSDIEVWVLPDDFIIHQRHEYEINTRKKERRGNLQLFENFVLEVCKRYEGISKLKDKNRVWKKIGCENATSTELISDYFE